MFTISKKPSQDFFCPVVLEFLKKIFLPHHSCQLGQRGILIRPNPMRLKQDSFFYRGVRFLVLSFIAWLFLSFLAGCVPFTGSNEERPQGVLFTYQGGYRSVCLSGDFNGWATDSHCLQRDGRTWKIQLFLSPGQYRYVFILNGNQWETDPRALLMEEDGFGRKNSVVVVE